MGRRKKTDPPVEKKVIEKMRTVIRKGDGPLLWDTGRPVLIGDSAQHPKHGSVVILTVSESEVIVSKANDRDVTFNVPPGELTREFDIAFRINDDDWRFN